MEQLLNQRKPLTWAVPTSLLATYNIEGKADQIGVCFHISASLTWTSGESGSCGGVGWTHVRTRTGKEGGRLVARSYCYPSGRSMNLGSRSMRTLIILEDRSTGVSLGFSQSTAILEHHKGLETSGRTAIGDIITNVTTTDVPRDEPRSTAVAKKNGIGESQPPVKKRRLDFPVSSTACCDNGSCRSQYIYGGVV